jgi:hypothetical protein
MTIVSRFVIVYLYRAVLASKNELTESFQLRGTSIEIERGSSSIASHLEGVLL